MTAMTFQSTLIEKIRRSADTCSYRFTRPQDYRFQPGQWFTIALPGPDGPLDHHFSHADSPTEPHIELTTRLTGSEFKNTLDALPIGAEAEIMGPFGGFLYRYDLPKIAFLTGGIGVTPVRSMMRYLADSEGEGRANEQQVVIFYGSMTEDGIVYKDEFDEFERVVPRLKVVHVITNPTPMWTGHQGFITAEVIRQELPDIREWTYYVVGPPAMITAMDKVTDELQIPREQRVVESFAGYES
jgi:glycine betaine catabolism B